MEDPPVRYRVFHRVSSTVSFRKQDVSAVAADQSGHFLSVKLTFRFCFQFTDTQTTSDSWLLISEKLQLHVFCWYPVNETNDSSVCLQVSYIITVDGDDHVVHLQRNE